ncbi:MAG: NTP transferase domain-containing protein, partial [Thermoplasmata archaeon]
MGTEKAMVPFRGRPLVLSVLDVLARVGDEVIASVTADPSDDLVRTLGGSVTIVPDREPGMGPVGGLLSALPVVRG